MKLKIFVTLTFVISMMYLSCNKDSNMFENPTTTEMIDLQSDIIDLNKLKMPYFATAEEYLNTIEKVKTLNGQEYLDWEKEYGIQTIYGDFTKARLELDDITEWDDYLEFRKKWKNKVMLPPLTDSILTCRPIASGIVSRNRLKILNKSFALQIRNKIYLLWKDKAIVFDKKYQITKTDLNKIVDSNSKIGDYKYFVFQRVIKNNNEAILEQRDFDDGYSPLSHPFINYPVPAAKFCSQSINPAGADCRWRYMRAHLSDVFGWWIPGVNDAYTLTLEQDYWVDFYRKIWVAPWTYRWFHNDVDKIEMNGDVDGVIYFNVVGSGYSSISTALFDFSFDTSRLNDDRWAIGITNTYVIELAGGANPNSVSLSMDYGLGGDMVRYFGTEQLGWVCDYKVIDLECSINWP